MSEQKTSESMWPIVVAAGLILIGVGFAGFVQGDTYRDRQWKRFLTDLELFHYVVDPETGKTRFVATEAAMDVGLQPPADDASNQDESEK